MPTIEDLYEVTEHENGYTIAECKSCGRGYPLTGEGHCEESDLLPRCPGDDCPSRWEEVGIPHPDHS